MSIFVKEQPRISCTVENMGRNSVSRGLRSDIT
jgi:hypothetical protein